LTKVGAGVLNLSGANTFTGGFNHNSGTVRVNTTTALGAANSTVNLANGTVLSVSSTTARILTYAFNVNGDITLGQAVGGTAAVTLAGSANLGGANRTINVVTPVATITAISAVITNGGLTKVGTGTLALSGNNLYTGDTTNTDGFISLNTAVSTPFGSVGTLYLNGGSISTTGNRDTLPIQNPIVMLTNAVFEGDTTGAGFRHFPINGQVTTVDGTLTLKNTNTVNGIWNTRLHAGGMNFTRPIILGVSGDPGGVQLSSYNTNGAGDQTFSGIISGYGIFARGATTPGTGGKTILTESNSYSGGTAISDGTLAVNNTTGSGTGSGAVTLTSPGVLAGGGIVSNTVSGNGTVSPGNSVGTLTLRNGLDLSSGGTYEWQLGALKDNATGVAGTDWDKIALTGGSPFLGGTSKVSITFTGSATAPDVSVPFWKSAHTWTILSLGGTATNPTNSNFKSISNGVFAAGNFSNSLSAGSVTITFSPFQDSPPVVSGAISGGTNAVIIWTSISNRTYSIEYKTNLNQIGWIVLTNITATNSSTTFIDNPAPAFERYYHVGLQP